MTAGGPITRQQLDLMELLAHDLKNQIGSALASLGFAEEAAAGDPEVPHALHDASTAVRTILRIVEDVTVATRCQAGEVVVRKRPCSAWEIVNAVSHGEARRIETACPRDLTLSADPPLLRRALDGLVEASTRWGKRDGAILVGARSERDRVILFVAHDAPTLSTEPPLRALAEHGSAAPPASIGLALYFARSISEAHGGALVLRSAPNWATEIGMEIP